MRINAITFTNNYTHSNKNNDSIRERHVDCRNMNFGKRSPQDFYEQDFNKRNMPVTMKHYLYADFANRSKIAPVQIVQEAFDDLTAASTVDDIKELFPNEPKFAKLRPANYAGATSGILKKIKDIKALQDVPEPLFKDGSDDLTTYLVKKIYLEGKTVKEIDKDFARDINPIYELAARIPDETKKSLGKNESAYFSHSTVYNLGIRFPEVPFWNSFIATRDDYERTNRVRLAGGKFVDADSAEAKAAAAKHQPSVPAKPKPRRYNFKRHEIKQISDSIVNSKGETSKALKNAARSGRNFEELTFLQKYWSDIMSVATEKIHLSEEMIDFNATRKSQQTKLAENTVDKLIGGIDFSAGEKTPLQIFWNERTDLKGHFSNAITDTVLLFTDAYGADGNNDEFKALLQYSQSLKPEREARKLEHARIQAEYDEMAKTLQTPEPSIAPQIEALKTKLQKLQPEEFTYTIDGKEIKTPFDIRIQSKLGIESDLILLPKQLTTIYRRELDEITKDDKVRFWLSTSIVNDDNLSPDMKELLYSEDELRNINRQLINVMEAKHNPYLEATRFSIFEYAGTKGLLTPQYIQKNARRDILYIRDEILNEAQKNGTLDKAQQEMDSIFKRVFLPLTNKEKIAIRQDLFEYLKNYDMGKSYFPETFIPRILKLISENMKEAKGYCDDIKTMLKIDTIPETEGPVLRQVLSPKNSKEIKNIIRERAIQHIITAFPELTSLIATANEPRFNQLMAPFPEEMRAMLLLAKKTVLNHFKLK